MDHGTRETDVFIRTVVIGLLLVFTGVNPVFAHQDPEIAGYIDVDGGRIWYRLNGARHLGKKPAIIVAHGGPGGTHRGNMPYVALSDSYPVILYDQLGTGNSDRPGDRANWNTKRFVDEIDHIRAALDLKEVIVAGHSWGGTVAAEYAVRTPKGLIASILSSPLISTPVWNADGARWIMALPKATQEILRKHQNDTTMESDEYRSAVDEFYARHMCRVGRCTDHGHRAGGPAGNDEMYATMWGPTDFRGIGTLKDYDLTPKLPQIAVPTLFICGEFDEAAPQSCRRFSKMIAGSSVAIIPDAGHATMAADEAFYLKIVRQYLAALPAD